MHTVLSFGAFVLLLQLTISTANRFEERDFNDTISVARAASNYELCCPRKTYVVGRQQVTWYQAVILCQQNGMELATITSAQEEAAVEELLNGYLTTLGVNHGYWIAATRNGACSSDFVWLTLGRPLIYSKFAPGQPDNAGGKEGCVEVFLESKDRYLWNDLPCDSQSSKIGFVCQTRCCCAH